MTESIGIIVGAVIGGAFGVVSAAIVAWFMYRSAERKRIDDLRAAETQTKDDLRIAEDKRADELFSTALEFMGGSAQRRNLGIAAITLYWRAFPDYKNLCAEVLTGSAIYLLMESNQKDKSHESFNLHRIMDLLQELSTEVKNVEGYIRLKTSVQNRLVKLKDRPAYFIDKSQRGLWVTKQDLEVWEEYLNRIENVG